MRCPKCTKPIRFEYKALRYDPYQKIYYCPCCGFEYKPIDGAMDIFWVVYLIMIGMVFIFLILGGVS